MNLLCIREIIKGYIYYTDLDKIEQDMHSVSLSVFKHCVAEAVKGIMSRTFLKNNV